jgi:hypothetical protein
MYGIIKQRYTHGIIKQRYTHGIIKQRYTHGIMKQRYYFGNYGYVLFHIFITNMMLTFAYS